MSRLRDKNTIQTGQLSEALHEAVGNSDIQKVKLLVAAGADPGYWCWETLKKRIVSNIKRLDDVLFSMDDYKKDIELARLILLETRMGCTLDKNVNTPLPHHPNRALKPKVVRLYEEFYELSKAIASYRNIIELHSATVEKAGGKPLAERDVVKDGKLSWTNNLPGWYLDALNDMVKDAEILRVNCPQLYSELMHDPDFWASPEDIKKWEAFSGWRVQKEPPLLPAWKMRALEPETKQHTALARYLGNDGDSPEKGR